jgi:hypothetical protein
MSNRPLRAHRAGLWNGIKGETARWFIGKTRRHEYSEPLTPRSGAQKLQLDVLSPTYGCSLAGLDADSVVYGVL